MQSELLTRAVSKAIPQSLAEEKLKSGKKLRLYWGIDPTGNKIHLGHAVPLRKMQEFVNAGHEVIFLVGSFTAMIGDPSGRDALREPLTKEQVEENFKTYKEQAAKVLDFSKVHVRYNHEWLEKLTMKEILGLSTHFTVNQMIERDMFEKRLNEGKPIAVSEFMYPLMVGYDSVMLDVDVELGGTDQEFNMLAGRTLQKAFGKREKFVLTVKLLVGTDGRKMSKTYDNCVYIDDSATEMYGKLMSVKDELIATYMECCTDIPMEEIDEAVKAMKKGANPKEYKMQMAKAIVTLYHGEEGATAGESHFSQVFAKGGVPDEMPEISVKKGILLIDALVEKGIVPSKSEAKRLITQKGITMNDAVIESIDMKAEEGIVKVGKRKFVKVVHG